MNKTGTTSLNKFFLKKGLSAIDDSRWWYESNLQSLECNAWTDGFEGYNRNLTFPKIKNLKFQFPKAFFILQTRPLSSWLLSRLRHSEVVEDYFKFAPKDKDILDHWTIVRNNWHEEVLEEFKEDENFLLLDISQDFKSCLEAFLGLDVSDDEMNFENYLHGYKSEEREDHLRKKVKNFLEKNIVNEDWDSITVAKYLKKILEVR